ncbi:hypothetical protein SCB49_13840 [unidentified eubacterium SCB49]|nr:hypothetical protein SCB49_13840 [unidentified eubacterium SCB49]
MKFILLSIALTASLISCKNETKNIENPTPKLAEVITPKYKGSSDKFAASIERAHNKAVFVSKDAVSFDIAIQFGGKERLNGTMTLKTDSSHGLIELADGNKMFVNGNKLFVTPGLADNKGARFDAFTWSYFALFPFKLGDEGTQWSNESSRDWNQTSYDTKKLSFKAGSGDTPDDWYVIYKDKTSDLLTAASYIVTFGKTVEKAESDPHVISYDDYVSVDGVRFAKDWKFWGWTEEDGFGEDQIGAAQLSKFKFVATDDSTFKAPDDAIEVAL